MRKLLLATTMVMGASLGGLGVAQAQIVTVPTLLSGTSPFGGPTVAPGSVVIRLGGRVEFFAGDYGSTGDKVAIPATATNGFANQSFKQQNYGFAEYMRLYPSVDGVAANGLRYGAFVELRNENYQGSGNGAGGGGVNDGSGGSSSSANTRATQIYVRREYVYLGAPGFGTLRLGSTDGPSSLFQTGTFENFNDGAWNGDVVNMIGTAGSAFSIPFADVGILYTTGKAVYLSPRVAGFDFGVAYEPTPYSVNDYGGGNPPNLAATTSPSGVTTYTYNTSTNCAYSSPGCALLSSASNTANRRRNLVDAAVRYTGTFGPVGVAGQLGWIGSQHDGVEAQTNGTVNAGSATRYSGLNVGDAGLVVSFGGLAVGGHVTGGKYNGQWGLNPVGATPAVFGLAGFSYTVGPLIFGASAFQLDDSGSSGPKGSSAGPTVGQQRTRGYAAGATYSLAPGVAVFVDYLNGNIKENGVNLLGDGEAATTHNQLNAQAIAIGTFVRW